MSGRWMAWVARASASRTGRHRTSLTLAVSCFGECAKTWFVAPVMPRQVVHNIQSADSLDAPTRIKAIEQVGAAVAVVRPHEE